MKNAYKGILGVIFVLATMGGLSCVDVDNSSSGSVTTTPVVGSGNIVEEFRSVTGATGVDLQSVANLKIVQGTPEDVAACEVSHTGAVLREVLERDRGSSLT